MTKNESDHSLGETPAHAPHATGGYEWAEYGRPYCGRTCSARRARWPQRAQPIVTVREGRSPWRASTGRHTATRTCDVPVARAIAGVCQLDGELLYGHRLVVCQVARGIPALITVLAGSDPCPARQHVRNGCPTPSLRSGPAAPLELLTAAAGAAFVPPNLGGSCGLQGGPPGANCLRKPLQRQTFAGEREPRRLAHDRRLFVGQIQLRASGKRRVRGASHTHDMLTVANVIRRRRA